MNVQDITIWAAMRRAALSIIILLYLAGTAMAGQFEDASKAYKRGEYATAVRLWRPLAERGHAETQFALGIMYQLGLGMPQDWAKAAKWYRKAAEQGHASAPSYLGLMYDMGQGVLQDYVQAHKWYNIAAFRMSGETRDRAVKHRDDIAAKMTPAQIAEARRLTREWKPKSGGR